MPDTIINMQGAGTGGTEESVSVVDIPEDGIITGIQVSHFGDLDADEDVSNMEISFIASLQMNTNDTRASLVVSRLRASLVTSGLAQTATNFYVPMNVRVFSGERLHMHFNATAGVASGGNALIHLETSRTVPRRSVRRR